MRNDQGAWLASTKVDPDTERDAYWGLALAVNAAFKGLLGSLGQSGHICQRAIPVKTWLDLGKDRECVFHELSNRTAAKGAQDGDVVVIPDKIVAVAEGRLAPRSILLNPDPKKVDASTRQEIVKRWNASSSVKITETHLLLADEYRNSDVTGLATLGTADPNEAAGALAALIRREHSLLVDVVVSDTDTGLDVRTPLIGTVTIAATPLGATRGLNIYECMRCACAAEFVRGHTRGVPAVICRPAERCQHRPKIGELRPYPGFLDAAREDALTYV